MPANSTIRTWAEMIKFSHSIFALPFALMGAFLAARNLEGRGWPYPGQLGLIVICMVAARSVAMTFNRIVDAAIDARNPRTAGRPIPTGRISVTAAWIMLSLAAVTFGASCLGFHIFYGNTWPMLLSGPVLIYLCGYSLTKRFTKWSHYYLGSALSIAPLAAWIAIHPESVGYPALLLVAAVLFWVAGFDIIYACQDIDADRRDGLHSLPSRIGPSAALWIARASHVLAVAALAALGISTGMGTIYAIGVMLAAILLVIENAMVRPGHYRHVGVVFFTVNGIVSIVLASSAIADMLIPR